MRLGFLYVLNILPAIYVTGIRIDPSTSMVDNLIGCVESDGSALAYGPAANQPRTVRSFAENQVGSRGIIRK
jgi:hypothetical protein